MRKTEKKQMKLLVKDEREEVLEYCYAYIADKLFSSNKNYPEELSETEKLRNRISDMLESIDRKDMLNYIRVIVSDMVVERKNQIEEMVADGYRRNITETVSNISSSDILGNISVFVDDIAKEDKGGERVCLKPLNISDANSGLTEK